MIFLFLAIWISIGTYIVYNHDGAKIIDEHDMPLYSLYFWTLLASLWTPIFLIYLKIKHAFL